MPKAENSSVLVHYLRPPRAGADFRRQSPPKCRRRPKHAAAVRPYKVPPLKLLLTPPRHYPPHYPRSRTHAPAHKSVPQALSVAQTGNSGERAAAGGRSSRERPRLTVGTLNCPPPSWRAESEGTSVTYADEQCAEQQTKRSAASGDGVWPGKTDAGLGRHRPLG